MFPIIPDIKADGERAYQQLKVRLDFYSETVLLTRFEEGGARTTYPAAVADLAAAFTGIPLSSGLLPPRTVFWSRAGDQDRIGIYRPARVQEVVNVEAGKLTIPLPPLLFIGHGANYSVYALKGKPDSDDRALFHAPLPNVGTNGRVCRGDVAFPRCSRDASQPMCSGATIRAALELLLSSRFNNHEVEGKSRRHPGDVRMLWQEIAGRRRFPVGDLVPMGLSLGDVIHGR
jgi:PRTRC genetic system protein B